MDLQKKVVKEGDRIALKKLLTVHRYDPNSSVNEKQETILHVACCKGYFDIVRTLIEVWHCDLMAVDIHGNSPFHTACAYRQLKIVAYLCHNIYSIPCEHLNNSGDTVLHVACKNGSVPMVRLILCEIFVSRTDEMSLKQNMFEDEVLPILFCINHSYLLNSKFHVDGLCNSRGYTPIHEACSEGHLNILKFFFTEVRMSLSLPNLLQCIPSLLGIACKFNYHDIVDYMHCLYPAHIHTPIAVVLKNTANVRQFKDYFDNRVGTHHFPRKFLGESSIFFAVRHANKALFDHLDVKGPYDVVNSNGDTLLHAACVSCDLEMVTNVWPLIKCEDRLKKNKQGNTCLHLACEWGSPEIACFLIKKNFEINEKNCLGHTPFHLSIMYERFSIFEHLLGIKNSCDFINSITSNGETPLHLATSNENLENYAEEIVKCENFNSINVPDIFGDTPLFNACRTGNENLIKLVIGCKGCDILHVNKHGETVFYVAARLKVLDVFFEKLHLDGSLYPPKHKNLLGQTLLHVACSTGDFSTVNDLKKQLLYQMNEDINLVDKINEMTPLQYACKESDEKVCALLLEVSDCYPDTQNKEGDTVLHTCAKNNLLQMVKLCKMYSSITVRNALGDTSLHVACKHGNYELAEYLLKGSCGKQLDSYCNAKGDTVLHVAAGKEGALGVIKRIIELKICDHKAMNEITGLTALDIAFSEGILENANYLLHLEPQQDEKSWFRNGFQSPLCYAVKNSRYEFLKLFKKSACPWFFNNCSKVRHPFDNLLKDEYVTMPLLHFMLYAVIVTHKDKQSEVYQKQHCRPAKGSDLPSCELIRDFLSICLDENNPDAYKMHDSHKCSLLHYFALCDCNYIDSLADKMLEMCEIEQPDKNGQLPLHFACYKANELVIFKILEKQNAHELLHCKTYSGLTPPDMCREYSTECTSYLLSWGAEMKLAPQPTHKKNEGITSIGIAVLGNSSVGKTTLIHALKKMLLDNRDLELEAGSTTGIVTSDIQNVKKSSHLYTFYDFAGQIEFETSHSVKLGSILSLASESPVCSPFIFLLVVKGSDHVDVNKAQINKWLYFACKHMNISNRSVHIALVCTHDDQFKNNDLKKAREDDLKKFLSTLDVKPLKIDIYELPILLNGKTTDTNPIFKLLTFLEDKFFSSQPVQLSQACEAVHNLIYQSFPEKPCQVKELAATIKKCHIFQLVVRKLRVFSTYQMLPYEKKKLVQILKQLHIHNDIVLLCNPSSTPCTTTDSPCISAPPLDGIDIMEWWIINKKVQNIMFSKVSSIFSPKNLNKDSPDHLSITHNTGVVPAHKLSEIFSGLPVPIDVVQEYLISMEYCKCIDNKEVLGLITDGESRDMNEEHFFFPGLIKKEKGDQKLSGLENGKCYGWLLESEEELGLRFLHSLLLRLTFRFSHKLTPVDNSKYKRGLHLWKNGLYWCTDQGINVLVEVIMDSKVVAIFQCSDEKLVPLAKYRSDVITEIRNVLKCSKVKEAKVDASEYFLNPPPNFSTDLSKAPLGSKSKIALDACVYEKHNSRTLFTDTTTVVSPCDLLGFDSCILLEVSTLKELKDQIETSLSPDTVGKVESQLGAKVLACILEINLSSGSMFEELVKNGIESTKAFCSKLEKYSIIHPSLL